MHANDNYPSGQHRIAPCSLCRNSYHVCIGMTWRSPLHTRHHIGGNTNNPGIWRQVSGSETAQPDNQNNQRNTTVQPLYNPETTTFINRVYPIFQSILLYISLSFKAYPIFQSIILYISLSFKAYPIFQSILLYISLSFKKMHRLWILTRDHLNAKTRAVMNSVVKFL